MIRQKAMILKPNLNVGLRKITLQVHHVHGHSYLRKTRFRIQDSRRLGCDAKMFVRKITYFPEFDMMQEKQTQTKKKVRQNSTG